MQQDENRLSRIASGLQEACWLFAACMVPLLFNPRGGDLAYQPFKFGVLIILSTIGMAAWVVRAVNSGTPRKSFSGNPLLPALGLLGMASLISTSLSVDRVSSVWGAPETFQGIATLLATLCLAALVACNLRSSEQLRRLTSVMILAGFATAVLAILQRAGFDPHHPELQGVRTHSTAGHSIYLGGYLLMVIPLTIWRLFESRRFAGFSKLATAISGFVILAVQVAGFVCAESRGPAIALGVTLLALALFLAVHHRRRSWMLGIGVACLMAIGGVVAVSSGALPKGFGAELPILKRFLKTKSAEDGIETYRAQTWKIMPGMMVPGHVLPLPSGGSDRLHAARVLFGYGPETLQGVLPQQLAWKGTSRVENRFHNLVWDQFFSIGVLGLAGLFAVFVLTFQRGFQVLGWIRSRRDLAAFASVLGICMIAGAVAAAARFDAGFIGIGLVCGLAGGVLVFAASRMIRNPLEPPVTLHCGLLIAVLAGLVGHLVDMGFVFPTAPTAVMFALFIGMVHAAARFPGKSDKAEHSTLDEILSRSLPAESPTFVITDAAVISMGVITLLFGFLHQYSYEPMSVGALLEWSLSHPKPVDGRASLLWLVPVLMGLIGGLFFAGENAEKSAGSFGKRAGLLMLSTALAGFTYLLLQASLIVGIGSVPPASTPLADVVKQAESYRQLFSIYLIVAGLLLVATTLDLARPFSAFQRVPLRGWIATCAALLLAGAASWQFALRPLQANLASQWGAALTTLGRPDFASEMFRSAIRVDPRPFAYRGLLATSLLDRANTTRDPDAASKLLAESERILLEGRAISQLNSSHFYLGDLYLRRALGEARPARDATAARASSSFARAMIFEPLQEQAWTYASINDRLLLDDAAAADRKLQHSLQLPSTASDVAAASYGTLGTITPDTRLRAEFARIAMVHYDRLIATTTGKGAANAMFEKAKLMLANKGDSAAIEAILREAIPNAAPEIAWQVNGALAEILLRKQDLPGARLHLENALRTAPENMRQPIMGMIKQLGGGK